MTVGGRMRRSKNRKTDPGILNLGRCRLLKKVCFLPIHFKLFSSLTNANKRCFIIIIDISFISQNPRKRQNQPSNTSAGNKLYYSWQKAVRRFIIKSCQSLSVTVSVRDMKTDRVKHVKPCLDLDPHPPPHWSYRTKADVRQTHHPPHVGVNVTWKLSPKKPTRYTGVFHGRRCWSASSVGFSATEPKGY